jgi:small-conductance mechanosensitive channel
MPAAADAARQKAQDSLNKQRQENKQLNSQQQQLQSKLLAAEQASEQAQRQVWELEKTRAGLAEQVTKLTSDVEFMEGEMTGLRDQLLASTEQVSGIIAQLFVAMYSLCWASHQKVTRHVHNSTYRTWVHLHISVEFAGQFVTAQDGHHNRVGWWCVPQQPPMFAADDIICIPLPSHRLADDCLSNMKSWKPTTLPE